MQKQILLFLLFFRLLPFLRAQNSNYCIGYFPSVNKAELAIVAGDYALALQAYQAAFSSVPSGLARDCHNAALCAMYLNQPEPAFEFFEKMALKGVTMEYFSSSDFAPLQTMGRWVTFKANYERLHREHLNQTDLAFRRDLTEMADLDQLFRQMEGSYAVYGDTIRAIDSINIQRFLRLLAEKGFPSEDRIGTDFPGTPIFEIVLHHHEQHLSLPDEYPGWPDLAPELVAAMQAGEIDPPLAAGLLELQNNRAFNIGAFGVIKLVINGVQKPEYYLDIPADRLAADQTRLALGLEPLADYTAKCIWRLDHPRTAFRLNDGSPVNIFEIEEDSAAAFSKGLMRIGAH